MVSAQVTAAPLGPCGKDYLYGHGLVDAITAAKYLEGEAEKPEQKGCEDGGVETQVTDITPDGLRLEWFIFSIDSDYETRVVYRGSSVFYIGR